MKNVNPKKTKEPILTRKQLVDKLEKAEAERDQALKEKNEIVDQTTFADVEKMNEEPTRVGILDHLADNEDDQGRLPYEVLADRYAAACKIRMPAKVHANDHDRLAWCEAVEAEQAHA